MSEKILEQKAYYIGTWKDNAVTDNIIREIATLTSLEKGRKVKLNLLPEGLKITKSNFFQGKTLFDYIPLHDIFFMTINQKHPKCLLCIVKDPNHKYMIVAFRCKSELIVGTFVQNFKALKKSVGHTANVEFRQKEDGNWTLRDRSNANARRELQQLFSTDQTTTTTTVTTAPQINGGLFYKKTEKRNGVNKKPTLYDQTPYVPVNGRTKTTYAFDPVSREDSYDRGRTIHNVGIQAIGTEDDSESVISNVSSMKDEIDALSTELREVKYLLEKSTGISAQEHYRIASQGGPVGNNNVSHAINYNNETKPNYTEPIVVIENIDDYNDGGSPRSPGSVKVDVPDYRRSFGVQTAPKTRSRTVVDGPEHLVAHSYRSSKNYENYLDQADYANLSELEKQQYRVHTVKKNGDTKAITGPEINVSRRSGGLDVEDGVIYAAERDNNVATVAYPDSTISRSRKSTGSVIVQGNPQTYTVGRKSSTYKVVSPSYGMVPSVIERPIEQIYPRPILIRRDYIQGVPTMRRRRPHSMYVVKPQDGTYVYGSQITSNEY
ncbi:uncharacterized protein LOC126824577 [Patella vulgata]|uniref:uncharacterized protein LOC126824577 n=1 Tax=Patella vulgata TaxID=6465 RepID=UPI00218089F9|nr:uncharacterized protein LOC126824577 [Patella vulgata]XP_050409777.1 uncharacterized protein LOC126824577 [Patella vulgata]XP_050409778.1 uncharacterized protein LOC126824577 [Patella vulgata]XP_050409779.1 uncharacterized protein LOC126824577 [Patella vulgata]XP_050409780.1 uncharacterized protein LOC126824577 [Patella vulgata]XP_050409781.1 uncharacterized protein LOC126824577 [Patella vulgata]XP_050409783.1 uncharacterized protein LOC126824577 [Patella vulgata]XP_050409784.1 uncharacte